MVLTVMSIIAVTPRGGIPTDAITITGAGFGAPTGVLTFDPQGEAVDAPPSSWTNDTIVFTVPALPSNLRDRTVALLIARQDGNDSIVTPFWVPSATPGTNALGFQYPVFEAGSATQDEDDPRIQSAADFNRLFDRVRTAGGVLPPLTGVQFAALMEDPIGSVNWRSITQDMIQAAFAPMLSLVGSNPVEVGLSVVSPQFNATYNRVAALATLIDNDVGTPQDVTGASNPITRVFTYVRNVNNGAVTFTLQANETGGPVKTSSVVLAWQPRVYFGVGVAGGSGEAFIKALASSALASSRSRSFGVTAGPAEKIYYAYPTAYGLGTFSVGGFVGGFLPPTTVAVTNVNGVTQNYYLYESTNVGLGATTVAVN